MGEQTIKQLIDIVKGSIIHKWTITDQERKAIILALEAHLDLLKKLNGNWTNEKTHE